MKKILGIINIAQANECQNLQTDYKIQRKNLKRYEQSLKIFKARISQNMHQMQSISKSLFGMHQNQSKSRKKASQIQYYMFNGIKVFGTLIAAFTTSGQFYADLLKRITSVSAKITTCLMEQKKKFEKTSELHYKEIKNYAAECFPETTSILFMIGFISSQKIIKKSDSFREMSIIEESKRYISFLSSCLDEMEQIKAEVIQICQAYYIHARDIWVDQLQKAKQTMQSFQINQQQVDKIADETGRVLTDRSLKDNQNQDAGENAGYDQQNDHQQHHDGQVDGNYNNTQDHNENYEHDEHEEEQHHQDNDVHQFSSETHENAAQ